MSVRLARKNDAPEMARVMYEGLRHLQYFSVLWPGAQKINWINVQTDYCVQHAEEPDSVAFVTADQAGTMSGMAYGRFLGLNTVPVSSAITMIGCDIHELRKLGSGTLQKALTEKYGDVLCMYWRNIECPTLY